MFTPVQLSAPYTAAIQRHDRIYFPIELLPPGAELPENLRFSRSNSALADDSFTPPRLDRFVSRFARYGIAREARWSQRPARGKFLLPDRHKLLRHLSLPPLLDFTRTGQEEQCFQAMAAGPRDPTIVASHRRSGRA